MANIIRLNRRHLKELAQIDLESEHPMEKHLKFKDYERILKERFNKKNELFFGYKEDNIIKGYITLKLSFPGHKHCEIYWLSVRSSFKRKGIGTKLIEFIENFAKKQKFRKICLYTNKAMKGTRKFYEKLGYKLINEFPNYYATKTNNTAVLYVKNI
jgi:ribosomal protein S18 acetylase RimI-like enzyme